MSNLINLINQHALQAAQSGNWQSVAAMLNALTSETRVTELRSARWLILQLTEPVDVQSGITITEADVVLGTLQQATLPRVKAAYESLCNGGLDLSDPQVQQMIPLLAQAASWPSGLAAKVLAFGVYVSSVIETTAVECQTEWNQQLADQAYATVQNEIVATELSSPTRTKASIAAKLRQAAAALEA